MSDAPAPPMTRAQEFEHLLLHPGVSAPERPGLLLAWEAGRDFRDQMEKLAMQAGESPEAVQGLQEAIRQLGDGEERP